MESLLSIGFRNALAATLLALLAFVVDRIFRRPALSHCFWLLVLIKLVTPPLLHVPLPRMTRPTLPAADLAEEVPAIATPSLSSSSEPPPIAAPLPSMPVDASAWMGALPRRSTPNRTRVFPGRRSFRECGWRVPSPGGALRLCG